MKIIHNKSGFTILLRTEFLFLTLEEAEELQTKLNFAIQDYLEGENEG